MDKGIGYIILACLAIFLLAFSIGYRAWPCNNSILSSVCTRVHELKVTGSLLIVALIAAVLTALFFILLMLKGESWAHLASLITIGLAALFALIGIFYYTHRTTQLWSPILAAISAGIALCMFISLIFDYSNY